MKYLVYQFEAVSIQNYIFSSSKLKETVQGSQMLEALTGELLDTILSAQGLSSLSAQKSDFDIDAIQDNQVVFARRAGGVFLAIFKPTEQAHKFIATWPLLVQQILPGLKFSVAHCEHTDISQAIDNIRQNLMQQKNTPAVTLPEISPIAQRNQRSGEAVVEVEGENLFDYISLPKHKTQYQGREVFKKTFNKWKPNGYENLIFPKCFSHLNPKECQDNERFPFSGMAGEHYVAVVHADGNGMGQYIKAFMESIQGKGFVGKYAQFSELLEQATQAAAQAGVQWLIDTCGVPADQPLPIRPLILSGDDVAMIIRADYALGFVQVMTQAFEEASQSLLKELETDAFPDKLTLTSGMVFLRSNQPFYMAYHLAEDLCAQAKKVGVEQNTKDAKGKTIFPSLTSFLLISNSLFDDADTQLEQEFTVTIKDKTKRLTHIPYSLGEKNQAKCPTLEDLAAIAQYFAKEETKEGLKVSFLRELATYLHTDPSHAKRMLERWQELNKAQTEKLNKALQHHFDLTLQDFVENDKRVPLADIILWHSMNTQLCKGNNV